TLKDPKKREMFDRYGSAYDSMGSGGPGGGWRPHPGGGGQGFSGFEEFDLGDIFGAGGGGAEGAGGFSDLFRQFTRKQQRRGAGPGPGGGGATGANVEHELQVPFRTAISGGHAQLTVRRRGGRVETIDVKIPAGIDDGKKIRLKGQGEPGTGGSSPGDILITIRVAPHPAFQRHGLDLIVKVPVTLQEAVLGAKIDVPTPKGTISLTLPPGTSSGKRLRVKGHGVSAGEKSGDLFAELQIVLPEQLDPRLQETLKEIGAGPNPRSSLVW
ncbi:MAG: hypothetical protein KDB23_29445, partial [Planctomycetales bacterium]|nr:hypothetical protein [Planctomycetales bacterium]